MTGLEEKAPISERRGATPNPESCVQKSSKEREVILLGAAARYFLPLILLPIVLTGCVSAWHPAMPHAHKYEGNDKAWNVYMQAFGDGFQNGWRMITTDMTPWDLAYNNDNPLLESACIDGFNDGEQAAWKVRTEYSRKRLEEESK